MPQGRIIYHICRRDEWIAAQSGGTYGGSSQDEADGFIHFSSAGQIEDSAARHRAGQAGLVLLAVDSSLLGPGLKWEPSRHGEPFPHLYGLLPVAAIRQVYDLPLDPAGRHVFPPLDE